MYKLPCLFYPANPSYNLIRLTWRALSPPLLIIRLIYFLTVRYVYPCIRNTCPLPNLKVFCSSLARARIVRVSTKSSKVEIIERKRVTSSVLWLSSLTSIEPLVLNRVALWCVLEQHWPSFLVGCYRLPRRLGRRIVLIFFWAQEPRDFIRNTMLPNQLHTLCHVLN